MPPPPLAVCLPLPVGKSSPLSLSDPLSLSLPNLPLAVSLPNFFSLLFSTPFLFLACQLQSAHLETFVSLFSSRLNSWCSVAGYIERWRLCFDLFSLCV